MNAALLKYAEVAGIHARSQWAYLWDQLLSSIHLVIIMFVFVQLWRVTYALRGGGAIDDYTFQEMIWYLVMTEAVVLSLPRIHATIESEVKGGDLALRLNKPYNYLLFHYAAFVGEGMLRFVTALLIGGLSAYLMVGGFPFRWDGIPVLIGLYLTTSALNFCYMASIGLLAFWTEDVFGLFLLFDRLKWILGAFFLPVEVYPDAVRRLVEVLPFRHMIGGPARLFVKFSFGEAGMLFVNQAIWLALFGAVCWGLYRLGVRRVDLNGG